ncbi:MAG: DUF885 domain-containing protein [Ramlibacter sp.]
MNDLTLTRRGMHRLAAAAALAAAPAWRDAWSAESSSAAGSPALAALAEAYYRGRSALFPLDATESAGDADYEAAFEIDIAPAHRQRQEQFYRRILAELRRIDPATLSATDRITHELLAYESQDRLALLPYPWHLMPVGHADSLPVRFAQWAGGTGAQPMKTTANYEHFLQRLEGMPAWIGQAIRNMEEGIARGIVLPRVLVERTLPQLQVVDTPDPLASPYLAGVRRFPDTVPERNRPRLAAAYRAAVTREIAPAVHRLHVFMRERYLPAARTSSGLGALPDGAAWYRQMVRSSTTTSLEPAAIHELGLREVARIRGEMEGVRTRLGGEGPLKDFLVRMDTAPEQNPFRSEDEVLAAYRRINERVKARLPLLFERAPKAALDIRAVEPIRRDTASDHYIPPAPDGSRPGVFYTVVTDPRQYNALRMTALFLHEGQPGHHYQIALAQELPLPRFRRAGWYDAHGEGWGLYAEGLGSDMGLYDDPAQYLGRLLMELHRAVRLVVDTGLHDKGWTREQAIAYVRDMEGRDEDSARRAIERYMAWPGQALSYKVGELKILELRERARTALGERFDIRAFHTQVLGEGVMPLQMLEARVDRWIAAQRA